LETTRRIGGELRIKGCKGQDDSHVEDDNSMLQDDEAYNS